MIATVLPMLSLFKRGKKKQQKSENTPTPAPVEGNAPSDALTWSKEAEDALSQATSQAPVPKIVKSRLKKELRKAAEAEAKKAGRTEVSAHDLMQGLMGKMPAEMRNRVEQAARKGPQGMELLQKQLDREQQKKKK